MRDSVLRGESPYASHLLLTQCLDDNDPEERRMGIACGIARLAEADASVVYVDRGISHGMKYGIAAARGLCMAVEYRSLDPVRNKALQGLGGELRAQIANGRSHQSETAAIAEALRTVRTPMQVPLWLRPRPRFPAANP